MSAVYSRIPASHIKNGSFYLHTGEGAENKNFLLSFVLLFLDLSSKLKR
jgi:hypothetical protein